MAANIADTKSSNISNLPTTTDVAADLSHLLVEGRDLAVIAAVSIMTSP